MDATQNIARSDSRTSSVGSAVDSPNPSTAPRLSLELPAAPLPPSADLAPVTYQQLHAEAAAADQAQGQTQSLSPLPQQAQDVQNAVQAETAELQPLDETDAQEEIVSESDAGEQETVSEPTNNTPAGLSVAERRTQLEKAIKGANPNVFEGAQKTTSELRSVFEGTAASQKSEVPATPLHSVTDRRTTFQDAGPSNNENVLREPQKTASELKSVFEAGDGATGAKSEDASASASVPERRVRFQDNVQTNGGAVVQEQQKPVSELHSVFSRQDQTRPASVENTTPAVRDEAAQAAPTNEAQATRAEPSQAAPTDEIRPAGNEAVQTQTAENTEAETDTSEIQPQSGLRRSPSYTERLNVAKSDEGSAELPASKTRAPDEMTKPLVKDADIAPMSLPVQKAADKLDSVIVWARPDDTHQYHMKQGRPAADTRIISAAESTAGPTKALFLTDPTLGSGTVPIEQQKANIGASTGEGAGTVQVQIDLERLTDLEKESEIKLAQGSSLKVEENVEKPPITFTATYPNRKDDVTFVAKHDQNTGQYRLYEKATEASLLRDDKPIMALTNIPGDYQALSHKDAAFSGPGLLSASPHSDHMKTDESGRQEISLQNAKGEQESFSLERPRPFVTRHAGPATVTTLETEARDARTAHAEHLGSTTVGTPAQKNLTEFEVHVGQTLSKAAEQISEDGNELGFKAFVPDGQMDSANEASKTAYFPIAATIPSDRVAAFAGEFVPQVSENGAYLLEIPDLEALKRFDAAAKEAGFETNMINPAWLNAAGEAVATKNDDILVDVAPVDLGMDTNDVTMQHIERLDLALARVDGAIRQNDFVRKPEADLPVVVDGIDTEPGERTFRDEKISELTKNAEDLERALPALETVARAALHASKNTDIGTAMLGKLDRIHAILTDVVLDKMLSSEVPKMREVGQKIDAQIATYEKEIRANMRDVSEDITQMQDKGYTLATEGKTNQRARRAAQANLRNNEPLQQTEVRKSTQQKAMRLRNLATGFLNFEQGQHKPVLTVELIRETDATEQKRSRLRGLKNRMKPNIQFGQQGVKTRQPTQAELGQLLKDQLVELGFKAEAEEIPDDGVLTSVSDAQDLLTRIEKLGKNLLGAGVAAAGLSTAVDDKKKKETEELDQKKQYQAAHAAMEILGLARYGKLLRASDKQVRDLVQAKLPQTEIKAILQKAIEHKVAPDLLPADTKLDDMSKHKAEEILKQLVVNMTDKMLEDKTLGVKVDELELKKDYTTQKRGKVLWHRRIKAQQAKQEETPAQTAQRQENRAILALQKLGSRMKTVERNAKIRAPQNDAEKLQKLSEQIDQQVQKGLNIPFKRWPADLQKRARDIIPAALIPDTEIGGFFDRNVPRDGDTGALREQSEWPETLKQFVAQTNVSADDLQTLLQDVAVEEKDGEIQPRSKNIPREEWPRELRVAADKAMPIPGAATKARIGLRAAYNATFKPVDSDARVRGLVQGAAGNVANSSALTGQTVNVVATNLGQNADTSSLTYARRGAQLAGAGPAAATRNFNVAEKYQNAGLEVRNVAQAEARDKATDLEREYQNIEGTVAKERSKVMHFLSERLLDKAEGRAKEKVSKTMAPINNVVGNVGAIQGVQLAIRGVIRTSNNQQATAGILEDLNAARQAFAESGAGALVNQAIPGALGTVSALASTLQLVQDSHTLYKTTEYRNQMQDGYEKAADLVAPDEKMPESVENAKYAASQTLDRKKQVYDGVSTLLDTIRDVSATVGFVSTAATPGGAPAAFVTTILAYNVVSGTNSLIKTGLEANRQHSKDQVRHALQNYMSENITDKQMTRLQNKYNLPPNSEPEKQKEAVVKMIIQREPALVVDQLLQDLRAEIPRATAQQIKDRVEAQEELAKLQAKPEKTAEDTAKIKEHETTLLVDAGRWLGKPVATFLKDALGVPAEHLMAIVDAKQTKDMDKHSVELLMSQISKRIKATN